MEELPMLLGLYRKDKMIPKFTYPLIAMGGQACTTIISLAAGDQINLFNTLVWKCVP